MRTIALTKRVLRQFARDKRTVALILIAPNIILGFLALIFNGDSYKPTIATVFLPPQVITALTDANVTILEMTEEDATIALDAAEVDAVISLKDGRKIYIKSDYAIYNRLTNDAEFMGNVLITESNNVIKSDNLDLNISKNLISAYNNVHYSGTEGFLIADQVLINMLKNEANIFMFEKKDRVKVKYKN